MRLLPRGTVDALRVRRGTVARTDTSDTDLFTLPKGAVILGIFAFGAAVSNAGTTAVLDVGDGTTGDQFVQDADVKTAGTHLFRALAARNIGTALAAATTITAKYAETGAASNAGGPWTIMVVYTA